MCTLVAVNQSLKLQNSDKYNKLEQGRELKAVLRSSKE